MIIPALFFSLLLDLSSAFDTVDRSILLNRLEHRFGIKDTALNWFRSYLTNRKQCVSIRERKVPLHVVIWSLVYPRGPSLAQSCMFYILHLLETFYVNMVSNTICTLMTRRSMYLFFKSTSLEQRDGSVQTILVNG